MQPPVGFLSEHKLGAPNMNLHTHLSLLFTVKQARMNSTRRRGPQKRVFAVSTSKRSKSLGLLRCNIFVAYNWNTTVASVDTELGVLRLSVHLSVDTPPHPQGSSMSRPRGRSRGVPSMPKAP